jgi:crotonobetainyl-CoA:carnitine CoA-transferase CaiB-like acyl-CoA transferase
MLGAALSLQAQRFVDTTGNRGADAGPLDSDGLAELARSLGQSERLDPYYRAHLCGDGGFVAVACLNTPQRRAVCSLFGLDDPFLEDPQAPPADAAELASRMRHASRIEQGFLELTLSQAVAGLAERRVPAAEVRRLEQLFADSQANANGLVQTVQQRIGSVALLGNVFKVDGSAEPARRGAPALDEHRAELLDWGWWE